MFFSQTEPTPIIIQYPNFSRAQRLQDAEMQLEKIKPSKADKLSDLSDEGIIFLYRKVDFEEEHHIQRSYFYTKVIFFLGVSASSTGEVELSGS